MSSSSSTPTTPKANLPRPPPSPLRSNAASPPSRRPGQPAAGKTRAKDLLRKHYGLGVGPPAPLPGNLADPMNLDSSAFDAKAYYDQLIATSSLQGLLRRENELLSGIIVFTSFINVSQATALEIRELDSERQSLVYNHHHELIAASDTIAAVKTRAESLDTDLDALMAAFSDISRLVADVSVEPTSFPK
ncbi:hypothetical protein ONZ45_g1474 [Pleurotus djamor]|nr:hypothetical protein ONZ45_g1474 [Pleurotus djamor]